MNNEESMLRGLLAEALRRLVPSPGGPAATVENLAGRIKAVLATQPAEQASAGSIGDDAEFVRLLAIHADDEQGRMRTARQIVEHIDGRPRQAAQQTKPIGYISDGVIVNALAKGFGASTYIQAGQPTRDFPIAIYAKQAPDAVRDAEGELVASILAWWEDHQYDTSDRGDRNVYDSEPEFVKVARKLAEAGKGE